MILAEALSDLTEAFIGVTNESGDDSAPPLSGDLVDETDSLNDLFGADSDLVKVIERITGDSRNLLASVSKDTGLVKGFAGASKASSMLSEAINGKASEVDDDSNLTGAIMWLNLSLIHLKFLVAKMYE